MEKQTKTEKLVKEMFAHIVDSNRGIYMGQHFAQVLNLEWCIGRVKGLSDDEWQALHDGPNKQPNDDYWLAVEKIDQVEVVTQDGTKYKVYWGDGIFLYPISIEEEINWDELS